MLAIINTLITAVGGPLTYTKKNHKNSSAVYRAALRACTLGSPCQTPI